MNKYELKHKLKKMTLANWLYIGGIAIVLIVVIVCCLVAMQLSGYSLVTWFAKYYGYVVLIGCGILIGVIWFLWMKVRKG